MRVNRVKFCSMAALLVLSFLAYDDGTALAQCSFDLFEPKAPLGAGAPLPPPPGLSDEAPAPGTTLPDVSVPPHDRFAQLDTLVDGNNRYCTAQLVGSGDILLTAAHCVRDANSGTWVSDFQLRKLASLDQPPVTQPKCIATPQAWAEPLPEGFPARFFWPADYALIVLPEPMGDGWFELDVDVADPAHASAYGLPVAIGRHDKLVRIPGVAFRFIPTMGGVAHKEEGAGLGMSGGAWVLDEGDVVVGLSGTNSRISGGVASVGPYFDVCAVEMLAFVRERCK